MTSAVSYQLPEELQTRKLNSLPKKERAIADQLIADKFGIGEVVSKDRRGINRIIVTLFTETQVLYMVSLRRDEYVDQKALADKVTEAIFRQLRYFARTRNTYPGLKVKIEFNGKCWIPSNTDEIKSVLFEILTLQKPTKKFSKICWN